ncbi:hypothetical protein ACFVKB_37640 [Rhodococcus sp. NPDC127530]|uniref:hypothetical protein n=1 Tax=unclassified Rhodococcus (in: high G+C Gram-positive bacteria) TaxID=192944 RepID=UPI0036397EFB
MSDRTAADLERELAMLASVRDRLRVSEGDDFRIRCGTEQAGVQAAIRIPTTAVDQVLDELNRLQRSPWDPS